MAWKTVVCISDLVIESMGEAFRMGPLSAYMRFSESESLKLKKRVFATSTNNSCQSNHDGCESQAASCTRSSCPVSFDFPTTPSHTQKTVKTYWQWH